MQSHLLVALVTLLSLLAYFWMGIQVGGARGKSGIKAPAMTGDPLLERTIRAHENTLEWLPIFLPSLWIFALVWNDTVAAGVGLVWVVGRVIYARGYAEAAEKREMGFMIQALAAAVLLFGALGKVVWNLVQGGAI
ncbi:MAG: MAPEG family protein [Alphaproteobacteria bacterium]